MYTEYTFLLQQPNLLSEIMISSGRRFSIASQKYLLRLFALRMLKKILIKLISIKREL